MFNTEPGPNSPWLNTDPRLAPDRTGLYWEAKQPGGRARPASAGAPSNQHRLGATVACGYGRAPTATVYTSAGTTLPTTALQSPQAMRDGGRGRLQAFAFSPGGFLGRGSFLGASASASAPTSPLDRRTLLYTRTAAGGTASQAVAAGGWGAAQRRQHEEPQGAVPQHHLPATDLLDRLALLRRLAPATDPVPRPPQLQDGVAQHGMAAQRPCAHAAAAAAQPQQPAPAGIKRWAWDDSLMTAGRPLTAGPAPGWRFCGEVEEPLPGEGPATTTAAAVLSAGGGQAALLVVRSPQQHRLCLGEEQEGEEEARWLAADRTAGDHGRRAAFRPPGPLKHKFGNKPQPRPRSAPGGGDKARVAGLRECGCPKSPRASGVIAAGTARHGCSSVTSRPQPTAADADVTTVEVTTGDGTTDVVVVSSPRPASGLDEDEQDVVAVAVTSSPSHRGGCSSEVVVVLPRPASPPPQPARPRQQPAAGASVPAGTRLTVSLPSNGRPSSYSIRADASSAAAAGSAGGSPIKAWRPAQQAQQAQLSQQVQQAQQTTTTTTTTTVSVDVVASPPPRQPGARPAHQQQQLEQSQQQPAAADHLQQLAGEIRRREQSFNSLLAELEAIQHKCAKLSGPACAKAPAAAQAGGAAAAGAAAGAAAVGGGVGLPRPRSGRQAAAAGQAGTAGKGRSGERDWSWQSLMDFEATIREQQRKLVEQGVLPPDYL
ncbi:hypothetical protein COHA_000082 [Chlorella ohadii]|uniref:Uncharacterized protein n=1 Tax=Chlorella ohadii TaxID=2649997 RepID=A0AAD5E076_9CHLO|nr:hypothetical protein COHA_000082 [Chlorella ohadii]